MRAYERRTRLYPALIVLLPVALGGISWSPRDLELRWAGGSLLLGLVVATLIAQLARDPGRGKRDALYEKWGGKPEVRGLRYSEKWFEGVTISRYHRRLRELCPDLQFPESPKAEKDSKEGADVQYRAAAEYLIGRTRDLDRFALIHEERADYAFRRTLWAMKPVGVAAALIGTALSGARFAAAGPCPPPTCPATWLGMLSGLGMLGLWVFAINPDWVRVAADAYGKQLIRACDQIDRT